jgi:hypothetical protein
MVRLLPFTVLFSGCALAQVCNPADLHGVYGFQLTGTNTISGVRKPTAAIGRIQLDGSGKISGYSSVNFDGYFLGNPVTGVYEAKQDCGLIWSLQDDSGAWQHFAGKLAPGGARAEFQQTDTGTGGRGVMMRTPEACGAGSLKGRYSVSFSGAATPFAEAGAPGRISAQGEAEADGAGHLALFWGQIATEGTYSVGSDCVVEAELTVPAGEGEAGELVRLRGMLVNGGKEVLAVQTDPGRVAGARFLAK